MTRLAAALAGAAAIVWAAGPRVLDPREVNWAMHHDWQVHFLGWHLFRGEPWQIPPGAIASLLAPVGTSLGYTDSIALMALVLKPFAAWLPNPFQYLGVWFVVCYSLQSFFGALVLSTWTADPPRRPDGPHGSHGLTPSGLLVGGASFVFIPALFARVAHPALSAHFLLLWALWLVWRPRRSPRNDAVQHAALGLVSGLVHPYLAVMVLALLAASLRLVMLAAAVVSVLAGWWLAGLFTLTSSADLAAASGTFSMNLNSVVNPGLPSHSFFLPPLPTVSPDQLSEGYQYLGVGVLAIVALALPLAIRHRLWSWRSAPLAVVCLLLTLYSVLPQVSLGAQVLLDVGGRFGQAVPFRSTGRFFWPVGYVIFAAACGVIATTLRPRLAAAVLGGALALQLVDLHAWWREVHDGARSSEFHAWDNPLRSEQWHDLLPRHREVRVYFPALCGGPAPVASTPIAYMAGLYGLRVNDGFAARTDAGRLRAACARFRDDFASGRVEQSVLYVMAGPVAAEFRARLGEAAECRDLDGVTACSRR